MRNASLRERYMMIATATVIGLFVLDSFVLSPLLAWRTDLKERHAAMSLELEEARSLVEQYPRMRSRWAEMAGSGLQTSITEAERTAYQAVGDWARASGVQVQSMNPERVHEHGALLQVVMRINASGPMRAVAPFLEKIDHAPFPMRVTQVRLSAQREGEDDLNIQLQVSVLVHRPAADGESGTPTPAAVSLDELVLRDSADPADDQARHG